MYSFGSGHQWKSSEYEKFRKKVKRILKVKPIKIDEGALKLTAIFGVSYKFDLDNALKPFIDILEEVYKFNDNQIADIHVRKRTVKRGGEFIEFELKNI